MGYRYCDHIKTDGEKCKSPAMGGRNYCYYHGLYRHRGKPNKKTSPALRAPLVDADDNWHYVDVMEPFAKRYTLGPLEDGPSLQVAISTVVNALADNRIDMGRASTLLYGLQLAASNLRNLPAAGVCSASETLASASATGTCAEVPSHQELASDPDQKASQNEELA